MNKISDVQINEPTNFNITQGEMRNNIKIVTEIYGKEGVHKALENQKVFWDTVLEGKLGYCLFKGTKKS